MAAAGNGEANSTPIWSATTNWIAAEESLRDSISFDTSENIENDQGSEPLILLRPDGDDPPPCDITINFREKHEIHRVYVRSTARVYEIYYSSDDPGRNEEYLCTVRCGAAIEEVTTERLNGYQGSNIGNVVRSDSNTSDEDGWVQVKSPDSLLQDDKECLVAKKCDSERDSPKMQIHYEATAEISDYSPCFSITIRLLSIKTKNCVHVEEIYVYADPVESCDPDPPVTIGQNSGASSMFAMLIPSLMQLSKSATSRDKSFSDEHAISSTENSLAEEMSFEKPPDKKWSPDQDQTEAKAVKFEVTAPQMMPDSLADQNNNNQASYTRIEKVLDDLVLKVGRVEAFCSKFEENMLKPFDCMEKRLQQLEQKIDALAAKSPVQCLCSKVASSESNEYNSNSEDGSINHRDQIEGSSIKYTEQREDTTFIGTASSVLEPQTHPGLIIKAPEFLNEDDEYSNTDDTLDPSTEDIPKIKKSSSIDSALASSLAAFLTSTTVKSPNFNKVVTAISRESINSDRSALDSLAMVPSDKSAIEDDGRDFFDSAGKLLSLTEYLSNMDTADDSLSPAFASHSSSGFIVMPLEFPNRYDFHRDNILDSSELDRLEDPASIARFRETVPPLAEFLFFKAAQCPKTRIDNKELSVSNVDGSNIISSSITDNQIKRMLDTKWPVGGSSGSYIAIPEGYSWWPWKSPTKKAEDAICNVVKFSSDESFLSEVWQIRPLKLVLLK